LSPEELDPHEFKPGKRAVFPVVSDIVLGVPAVVEASLEPWFTTTI
jgi:hypothetical protein